VIYPSLAAAPGSGLRVVVTSPPAVEPVSLEEAKQWSVVQNPDDDQKVTNLIVACREFMEADLGQALITQTRTAYFGAFPAGWGEISLPYPPIQSIVSIQYRGIDGNLGTLDSSLYRYTPRSIPGRVWLPFGSVWPVMVPLRDAVQVTYVCGYGDTPADLPMRARLAIQELVTSHYSFRESHMFMQGGLVQPTSLYESLVNSLRHGDYR
jgi:uncharacterized phiE125 gp8 family phage protein